MKHEFDNSRLKGRIVEKFGSCREFSKHVSQDESKISRLITGKGFFSKDIILEWCAPLEIEEEKIGYYFFCVKS